MKMLRLTRKTPEGEVCYETRALVSTDEREVALQHDCMMAIKASIADCHDKKAAEKIAKLILSASASVHSDLERILREGGKKREVVK